jgi:transcriptional regulator with XRE-family HTH domain
MSGFLGFWDSDHYYEGNNTMTIRDRIFARISELEITQKEFAKRTGIPETTVSDWKKKKTNPTAEKILIICKVLDVTPEWLLSGIETHGTRSNPAKIIAVDVSTEGGQLLELFNSCDAATQARILGYAQAFGNMKTDRK